MPDSYVFFCEGADERTLIRRLNTNIYGPENTIWTVAYIPRIIEQAGERWFTPKRILDYYLDTIGKFQEKWDYHYSGDFRPRNDPYLNNERRRITQEGAGVYLLVDTDVFFKRKRDIYYNNLTPEQNNILREGSTQRQKEFCEEFINANNYKFLEQELTFEDFVVLFFVGEDVYDESDERYEFDNNYVMWFNKRFRIDQTTNARQRQYSTTASLSNVRVNSTQIKSELILLLAESDRNFKEELELEKTPEGLNLLDWIRQNKETNNGNNALLATKISNWVINRGQAINWKARIEMAKNRIAHHQKWPFRFGLINVLEQEIIQNEN